MSSFIKCTRFKRLPDEGQGNYRPDSKIRWRWLELGDAAIML